MDEETLKIQEHTPAHDAIIAYELSYEEGTKLILWHVFWSILLFGLALLI